MKCDIPIISGVGHEVDVTIADFAADQRAATPSAAAELVSPSQQACLHKLQTYQRNLLRQIRQQLKHATGQTQWLQSRLKLQHPKSQLAQQSQQLDELTESLQSVFYDLLNEKRHQLKYAMQSLLGNRPDQFIDYQQSQLNDLTSRLSYIAQQTIDARGQELSHLCRTLQAVSPLNTLSRGYSIARDSKGHTITSADQVKTGDLLTTQLHEGEIKSRIE